MASTTTTMDMEAWAQTSVGAPHDWPPALRAAAQLCLDFPTPCCVLWGDRSRFLYNSPMAASIGRRHPSGMAQPLYDVFPSAWRTVGPVVHEVMRSGRPFSATRFPLQLEDPHRPLQVFVDFSLVPVVDEGRVLGVFAPVGNATRVHLDNQHHAAVAAVATVPTGLASDAVAARVARHLVEPDDVRFAVLFLRDPGTGALTRAATAGAPLRPAASLAALDVAVSRGLWPLERVLAERRGPALVGDSAPRGSRVSRPLWQDAWLVALPEPVEGVLVVGLDARFGVPEGPEVLVTRLAAVTGDRLAR